MVFRIDSGVLYRNPVYTGCLGARPCDGRDGERRQSGDVAGGGREGLFQAAGAADQFIRERPDAALAMYTDTVHKAGAELDESIIKTMILEVPKFMGVNFIPSDWTELPRTRDFLFKVGEIASKPDVKAVTDPSFGDAAEARIK